MEKRIYEGYIKVYDKETIIQNMDENIDVCIGNGYLFEPFQDLPKNAKIRLTVEVIETETEEETIPIPYGWIKYGCGWSKFCDITNHNHYAINEFGDYDTNHLFHITKSQAKQLGYINPNA